VNPGVYIGIPSYDGKLHHTTAAGLIQVARFCGEKHLSICVDVIKGDAFIGKARDTLVHRFLNNTDWEDFIFIDADIGFSLDGIRDLMICPEDIVAGMYRVKADRTQFPGLMWEPCMVNDRDSKLVRMQYMPTGFMRIKRKVFETMREKFPEDYYYCGAADGQPQYEFFPCGRTNHHFHGEDIAFCMRAIECGFHIWAIQDIELNHSGDKTFEAKWRVLREVKEPEEEKAA